ncbi:MAG: PEP-CTERM sorting domain-containing protein [Planctomycetaceae bacterium]|nr:PEP-CTERM sorting domain-containing protein [Planctomycetaceae bacterium]
MLLSDASAALLVQGYNAARNDRFYVGVDKAFVGDPYDWSGVGRLVGSETWATMISPSYFLSAVHYHPGAGSTIRFYATNDPAGPYEDHVVASGVQIGTSDVWVGKLTAPASSAVATYPLFVPGDPVDLAGMAMEIIGRSNLSSTQTNIRMGRNVINVVSSQHLWWTYDTPGLGDDEAQTANGDSGATSFVVWNGQPGVVGIHHYINGDSMPSYYVQQIRDAMGSEMLRIIPEPATMSLLLGGAAMLLLRKRRTGAGR